MIYALAVVGLVTLLALSGFVVGQIYEFYSTHKETTICHNEGLVRTDARKQLGITLQSESYQFSESKEAQALLRLAGEYLDLYGRWDTEAIRSTWRAVMKNNED